MMKSTELLLDNIDEDMEIYGEGHVVYAAFDETTHVLLDYDVWPDEDFSEAHSLRELRQMLLTGSSLAAGGQVPDAEEDLTWEVSETLDARSRIAAVFLSEEDAREYMAAHPERRLTLRSLKDTYQMYQKQFI